MLALPLLLLTDCTPPASFVAIDFSAARVVRSNLGGQGGQCEAEFAEEYNCTEPFSGRSSRPEIYIANIGEIGGEQLDLVVTNLTDYYPWENGGRQYNGIKVGGGASGTFGSINLKGPRGPGQSGFIWREKATYVELQYDFVTGASREEMRLPLTYVTGSHAQSQLPLALRP